MDFSQRPQLLPILSAATIRFRGALDRATKSEQKRADENDGHFKALYAQKDGKMEIRGLFEAKRRSSEDGNEMERFHLFQTLKLGRFS